MNAENEFSVRLVPTGAPAIATVTNADGTPLVLEPDHPRYPTADECSNNSAVDAGWAGWYPQMGGYTGKCVAIPSHGCWDVWVWHDGDFPFGDDEEGPCLVHHCEPAQFVAFGEWLESYEEENPSDV